MSSLGLFFPNESRIMPCCVTTGSDFERPKNREKKFADVRTVPTWSGWKEYPTASHFGSQRGSHKVKRLCDDRLFYYHDRISERFIDTNLIAECREIVLLLR
jgi:hypothetical protein